MDSDPRSETADRLEFLEEKFAQLQAQNTTISYQLEQLIDKYRPASPTAPPPLPTLGGISESKLKPATPNDFDGTRTKGRAFLNSVELYFRLVPHQFADEKTIVHWVLTFMKSGRAALFSE